MSHGAHPDGYCTCLHHLARPWRRPEHWTRVQVEYLTRHYGRRTDEQLSRHLGRSLVGIRQKAKRLGLHKRDAGLSAREAAGIFGVDPHTVARLWIRPGLLRARAAGFNNGSKPAWLIAEGEVERFILRHPEQCDAARMPESPYRDLAMRDPWIGLPEVHRRSGRHPHIIARLIRDGTIEGRKRGAHWRIREADLLSIRHLAPAAIEESWWRRQSVLEHRRNRRKGLVA